MSGRGGKDRMRRDYPMRSEEKRHHGRSSAPPSRHLWVGNLSHNLSEHMLADQFLQFGELESVAFQPGRSYAFINFKHEEAAFAAFGALQGFFVAGNPLRIEFAKAEKSTPSHDEDYLHRRDEQFASLRGSPYSQRDTGGRHSSPDSMYSENPKINDKSAEPSEVLWIGFPALLKVDEGILRKAFSPFGEIEKISSFPGRTYAFIRFKNVIAACRAKETLQGKLFGNPRVHICFARGDSGTSNSGRNSINAPPSPRTRTHGRQGSSDNFQQERYFENSPRDHRMRSPLFVANLESGDPNAISFDRKGNGGNGPFEQRRFQEVGSDLGILKNIYEHRSPPRKREAHFHDFPPQQFPRQGPYHDDAWDLPEDALLYHGAKKLKTSNNSFPSEAELPEYPFSDTEQVKHVLPRIPDFPQHEVFDNNFNSGPFGYHKQIPDPPMNITQPYDTFGSASLPSNPIEWKRLTPEPHQPPVIEEWKWEGTIAKGGTPICRARCFPVGKVLDMTLPEFLDCTARTGLDMLAKHYYQAASAWVVFFVPDSDADMGFYNEFMNYLGEKERAAVAKLDDKTTLFLVPPSEFSEKVLKVPGKLSISGVILRLEQPASSSVGSQQHPPERADTNFTPFHGEVPITSSFPKQMSPSGPYPPFPAPPGKPRVSTSIPGLPTTPLISFAGSAHANRTMPMPDSMSENRQGNMLHQRGLLPNNLQNLNSGGRNITQQAPIRASDPMVPHYNSAMSRATLETSSSNYGGVPVIGSSVNLSHNQEAKPEASSSSMALQQDQLAQLASSLLGQHPRQSGGGGLSMGGGDFRQLNTSTIRSSDNSYRTSQKIPLPNNQITSELPSSQYGQVQQFQQQNLPPMPQRELSTSGQGRQLLQGEEVDADPQKRLQATLQLAAALLQQIQQGKGT